MGLFTKANCAECGKSTTPVFRTKLKCGNYICAKCAQTIPIYAYQSFLDSYTLEDFRTFKQYKEYSDQQFRPVFEETLSYYNLHLDEIHNLFYIGYKIDEKTVFLQFVNVAGFNMVFKPKEVKNGLVGQKVEGDILFQLLMTAPYFHYEDKLAKDVKAKAKKELFGSTLTYENPKGMDEFIARFAFTWETSMDEDETENSGQSQLSELQQAMALFMLDTMEGTSLDELKTHRNRLIKAFHPDKGSAEDTPYAQKINNAYEVLKNYVETHG